MKKRIFAFLLKKGTIRMVLSLWISAILIPCVPASFFEEMHPGLYSVVDSIVSYMLFLSAVPLLVASIAWTETPEYLKKYGERSSRKMKSQLGLFLMFFCISGLVFLTNVLSPEQELWVVARVFVVYCITVVIFWIKYSIIEDTDAIPVENPSD